MIFLYAALYSVLVFFNPFLATIYGVGFIGDKVLKSGKLNQFFLASFGLSLLGVVLGGISKVDFFEILLAQSAFYVYFYLLVNKGKYDLAILGTSVFCFVGEVVLFIAFNPYYLQVIDTAFALTNKILTSNQEYLGVVWQLYKENFPSLHTVMFLFALYLGSILLGRKNEIPRFNFRGFALPKVVDLWLLAGIVLFVFRKSVAWSIGSNLLIVASVAFTLAGLGVVFTVWQKWFEKYKILYLLFVIVLVFNNYLVFILSFLGLLDRWFNFRKLS